MGVVETVGDMEGVREDEEEVVGGVERRQEGGRLP